MKGLFQSSVVKVQLRQSCLTLLDVTVKLTVTREGVHVEKMD